MVAKTLQVFLLLANWKGKVVDMTKARFQQGDIVQLVPMGDKGEDDVLPPWQWGKIGEITEKIGINVDGDLLLYIKTGPRKQYVCYLDEMRPLGVSTR